MANQNNNNGYDPKNLQIVFLALFLFQIFFLVGSVYLVSDGAFLYQYADVNFTLIPLAAIVLDVVGNKIFQNGFDKLTAEEDLNAALQKLNTIHIIRWILVEGATSFLLVFTIVYDNHFFTAFAIANMVYYSTLRPRLFRFNEGY